MAVVVLRLPRMVSLSRSALRRSTWIEHDVSQRQYRTPRTFSVAITDTLAPSFSGWNVIAKCGRMFVGNYAAVLHDEWVDHPDRKLVRCSRCVKSKKPVQVRGFEIILETSHRARATYTPIGGRIEVLETMIRTADPNQGRLRL